MNRSVNFVCLPPPSSFFRGRLFPSLPFLPSPPLEIIADVGYLAPQQHASVSQGRICTDNCTCCHTEIEVADQTFHLTQSQYTDTGPTSPSADPRTPGAWQGSQQNDSTRKKSRRKRDLNPGPSALETDALTTRPTRRPEITAPVDWALNTDN